MRIAHLYKRVWILTFLILVLSAYSSASAQNRPFTIDDLMKIKTATQTAISPDGSQVLYVVVDPDLKNSVENSDIWMVSASGGTPIKLTNGPKRDDSPRWSPDGKQVAFISDREGTSQIYLISPFGGEATKLTSVQTGIISFAWSPDGKQIAYNVPEGPTPDEAKKAKERDDTQVVSAKPKSVNLYVIDVASGKERQLTHGEFVVDDLAWSPNGKEIAMTTQADPAAEYGFQTNISVVSVEDGKIRSLVDRPGADRSPRWSPDGSQIAFESMDGHDSFIGQVFICLIPAGGGQSRNLSKSFDGDISSFSWAADGKSLFFEATRGVTTQLFSLSVDSGATTQITTGDKVFGGFSFSANSSRMALFIQTPSEPSNIYVSPVSGFNPTRLSDINPQVREFSLGSVEAIHWKSTDGTPVEGVLIKPVGYQAGKKYPLLTYAHGGPIGAFSVGFTPQLSSAGIPFQVDPYPVQVFANQGYAILCPNPRGSEGYGEKFKEANVHDWGGGDYQDIMSGIDYLIQQGLADPDKLGFMGWSYGGYMTSWVISQTTRFKAASMGAGLPDLYSFFGQTDIPGLLTAYIGGKPWENIQEWEKHSAMFHASNIKTPTLIQQGGADQRVPPPQGQELYKYLRDANIPVEYAVYPRQGHLIMEPKLQLDMLSRNLNWFNRWIKGEKE